MILIIQQDVQHVFDQPECPILEVMDHLKEITDVMRECYVYYAVTHTKTGFIITVVGQKVCLDESAMARLIYTVLNDVDGTIKYLGNDFDDIRLELIKND